MWFKLYVCMDIYCTGAYQNLMTKMSKMIGTWKTWSKIMHLVCQLWQAHHLQQHRLSHPEDNTGCCRYLQVPVAVGTCSIALLCYAHTIEVTIFSCLQEPSTCFPAAKEHQGTAEPRRHCGSHSTVCEGSQQSNHSAKERKDVPYKQ